ncbi:hypothetical protein KKF81_05430 [Candidatus Micrarchaeota archaeon]|nr:hypothetical protein [Candidatus Micrarchaeota archaeon]
MKQTTHTHQATRGGQTGKSVPDFVPKWMIKPDLIFDPDRALKGFVRSGQVKNARQLIEHYGLNVDKSATLNQAELNRDLIAAVDRSDVDAVKRALDEGANPRAAEYIMWGSSSHWVSVLLVAVTVSGGCGSDETRRKASDIVMLLEQKGVSLPFWQDPREPFY